MRELYALIPLLGGWLVYGLDSLTYSLKEPIVGITYFLISSGLIGGLIGGSIGAGMDIPQNLWWMRELLKIGCHNSCDVYNTDNQTTSL